MKSLLLLITNSGQSLDLCLKNIEYDQTRTIYFNPSSKGKLYSIMKVIKEEKAEEVDILFWKDVSKEEGSDIARDVRNIKTDVLEIHFHRVTETMELEELTSDLVESELVA